MKTNGYDRAMKTHHTLIRRAAWLAVFAPLGLTGCNTARTIAAQDSVYCDKQGFPSGTDGNFDCAVKRGDERVASGEPEGPDPVLTPPSKGPPAPPPHAGGVRQIAEVYVAPGATAIVNFSFSLKPDCTTDGVPQMQIDTKPEHGIARIVPRTDYANIAQNDGPPAECADKKVTGVALEYTPFKAYEGGDYLAFRTLEKNGAVTIYKAQVAVEKPNFSDDD